MSRRAYRTQEYDDDGLLVPLPAPQPMYPGTARDAELLGIFCIDVSGSMSDDDILGGLAEMKALKKAYPEVTLLALQVDTSVSHAFEITPETSVEDYRDAAGRTAGGGTSFAAPFELGRYLKTKDEGDLPRARSHVTPALRALAQRFDGVDFVVYHTDGYGRAPTHDVAAGTPAIWIITPNGQLPHFEGEPFGQIVRQN